MWRYNQVMHFLNDFWESAVSGCPEGILQGLAGEVSARPDGKSGAAVATRHFGGWIYLEIWSIPWQSQGDCLTPCGQFVRFDWHWRVETKEHWVKTGPDIESLSAAWFIQSAMSTLTRAKDQQTNKVHLLISKRHLFFFPLSSGLFSGSTTLKLTACFL